MRCIEKRCGGKTKVVDSRDSVSYSVRRRHECLKCGYRFTTYETPSKEEFINAKNNNDKYECSIGLFCNFKERGTWICRCMKKCNFKKVRDEYEDVKKET